MTNIKKFDSKNVTNTIQAFVAGISAMSVVTIILLRKQFDDTRLISFEVVDEPDGSKGLYVTEKNGQKGRYDIDD